MTISGLCFKCGTPGGFLRDLNPGYIPSHCYGTGDEPGQRGLIGSGFHCSCECRTWPHHPHDLYTVAAKETPGDLVTIRDRYRELMIQHGHLIPRRDKESSDEHTD